MAKWTTPETKAKILALNKVGLTNREIALSLKPHVDVDPSTVGRIIKKYAETPELVTEKPHIPGRPPKLSLKDVRFAALALTRAKRQGPRNIQRSYFPHISTPTLRRYLRQIGLNSYRRRKVPLLKYKQRKARFAWARMRLLWPQALWDDTIFSDEARIGLFGSDGPQYFWKYSHESSYDPRFTQKTVSHEGGGIFVWGCIMREGVGRLHLIDGTLTAAKYVEILRTSFFGTLSDNKLSPFDITFQHDRDPKHMAGLTQHWLSSHHVKVLPWPSRSPDLNIIEHVWWHLKQRVHSYPDPPRDKEELWKRTESEWKQIRPDYIASLYDSMPRRVRAVYAAKGGSTKY
jgi:hypothetical protein